MIKAKRGWSKKDKKKLYFLLFIKNTLIIATIDSQWLLGADHACHEDYCLNGGVCKNPTICSENITCTCPDDYVGIHCETCKVFVKFNSF